MPPVSLNVLIDMRHFKQARIIQDRMDVILAYAKGKKVLNVGCCGPTILVKDAAETKHRAIVDTSRYCCGIDIDEVGVKKMQDEGENVLVADAETFELKEKDFDLIVAGDLIEHLSNPGLFLEKAHNHLAPGGYLILTTPNPFFLDRMINLIFKGKLHIPNTQHTCWFDPYLLSLFLERSHFNIKEFFWCELQSYKAFLSFFIQKYPFLGARFGIIAQKF